MVGVVVGVLGEVKKKSGMWDVEDDLKEYKQQYTKFNAH